MTKAVVADQNSLSPSKSELSPSTSWLKPGAHRPPFRTKWSDGWPGSQHVSLNTSYPNKMRTYFTGPFCEIRSYFTAHPDYLHTPPDHLPKTIFFRYTPTWKNYHSCPHIFLYKQQECHLPHSTWRIGGICSMTCCSKGVGLVLHSCYSFVMLLSL